MQRYSLFTIFKKSELIVTPFRRLHQSCVESPQLLLRNTLPLCKSRNESRKGTFKGFVNELLALNGIEIVFRQNETMPPLFWKIPRSQSLRNTVYVVERFQFSSFSQSFTNSLECKGSFAQIISAKWDSTTPIFISALKISPFSLCPIN